MNRNEVLLIENKALIDSIIYQAEKNILHHDARLDFIKLVPVIQNPVHDVSKVGALISECFEIWDMNPSVLSEKSRKEPRPTLRKVVAMLLHNRSPETSLSVVASIFNQEDHTSVIHARQQGKNLMDARDYLFLKYYNPVKHLFI